MWNRNSRYKKRGIAKNADFFAVVFFHTRKSPRERDSENRN
jgi:hypothetical protein